MALDETETLLNEDERDFLETSLKVALGSAEGLLKLVEELLDINKLESGEVPLHLEQTNLTNLAVNMAERLNGKTTEAQNDLIIDHPDDLPLIKVDKDKIERVFINLLDNALRYTPSGGRIYVRFKAMDTAIIVSIVDTGT